LQGIYVGIIDKKGKIVLYFTLAAFRLAKGLLISIEWEVM
jgi:hypothetical protein